MKILCVIPSRIGSTRTPRKPLLPIQGKPMIQWAFENASRCKILQEVVVATDSEAESLEQMRVLEHGFKIRVCLTNDQTLEINTPEEYEQAQTFVYTE